MHRAGSTVVRPFKSEPGPGLIPRRAYACHIELRKPIPKPPPARGRPTVALPPLVAAKRALYEAMREAGLSNFALAERLGVREPIVRRLLDLDHRSHIGQVDAALRALGKRLAIEVRDAA